ncbi:MAG TPA: hypothetical protein VLA36_11640 [Longimicrobiales bacterium]|nr:hypothetical protein [Longimicrobiales bacterium]
MRKLVLLIILWFVVTYYFPDSRQWLTDVSRPLWVPVVKWNTREEMKQVGRDVINHELNFGKLPDRRGWLEWLDYRYPVDDLKKDSWGSTYQLRVWADSVAIWSYGPDRVRQTEDDFQVSVPRERRRRR